MLIDQHTIVRSGIALILKQSRSNFVIEESVTISDAHQKLSNTDFDLIILDINTKETDAIKAIGRFKKNSPTVKITVLSTHDTEPFISKCFDAGADAYLSKSCSVDELITSIDEVLCDKRYMSADVARHIALGQVSNEQKKLASLTQREYEIFFLLASGDKISLIAKKTHISPKTAYVHRDNIFKKLSVKNSYDLVQFAIRHNVI